MTKSLLAVLLLSFAAMACSEDAADDDPTPTPEPDVGAPDAMEPDPEPEDPPCDLVCGTGERLDEEACACVVLDDLDMTEEDFECITLWDKVRRFRITNKLGKLEETLAVANNPDGGVYPVGTIIQLIPGEAMVKRKAGFSEATKDWEFFFLVASEEGTEIRSRGTTEVENGFGGNCFGCHALAEPQYDLVCEQENGCDPLPFGEEAIIAIQNNDPRCE